MPLTFSPSCMPLSRAGAMPVAAHAASARPAWQRGLAALPQRGPRDGAMALGAAGFPGLSFDAERERAWVCREVAERQIDRLGLAFLRAESGAGAPPSEQLGATVEQLRGVEQGRPRAVKVELPGPISLALQLTDEQERPLALDPPLREALAQHVALRAAWLRELIESAGVSALVVLDEPFLDALDSPFCPLDWEEGGDLLARTLDNLRGQRGLSVEGEPHWAALVELPVDVIFFDAYEHGGTVSQAAQALGPFLERGGALAWGIVPGDAATLLAEPAAELAGRLADLVAALAAAGGGTAAQIAARSLVSTGTLTQLPPAQAAQATALCVETAGAARVAFGLDT
jgi:hypothetical protein